MKKSILILLAASSLLLVGCSKTEETKTSTSSTSSSSSSSQSSSASSSSESSAISTTVTDRKMNLKEVEQGNFESIQGTWTNKDGDSFTISGDEYITNRSGNQLVDKLQVFTDTENGCLSLWIVNQAFLFPAEAGAKFDLLGNNPHDYSDQSKDRFVLQANGGPSEDRTYYAFYRQ